LAKWFPLQLAPRSTTEHDRFPQTSRTQIKARTVGTARDLDPRAMP
jgi:hypothetical protein